MSGKLCNIEIHFANYFCIVNTKTTNIEKKWFHSKYKIHVNLSICSMTFHIFLLCEKNKYDNRNYYAKRGLWFFIYIFFSIKPQKPEEKKYGHTYQYISIQSLFIEKKRFVVNGIFIHFSFSSFPTERIWNLILFFLAERLGIEKRKWLQF